MANEFVAKHGLITPGVITSTIVTGTAPLAVSSSTLVNNLNADLLDGNQASAFATVGQTTYIGTTALTLNRSSANQGLTGISSIVLPGVASGTVTITPSSVSGSASITIPATSGTLITTGDSATVTNTMLAGSIANSKLTNSAITVGTTSIALGSSSTVLAGLTGVTIGSTSIKDDYLFNSTSASDSGQVSINWNGYLDGTTYYRNFRVFDGKQGSILLLTGSTKAATFAGSVSAASLNSSDVINGSTLSISSDIIYNRTSASDTGAVAINYYGYSGGTTYYRNFSIWDGKNGNICTMTGSTKATAFNGVVTGTSFNSITGLSAAMPLIESGTGVIGTATTAARADHVHPAAAGGAITYEATATNIKMNGTQAVGTLDTSARGDHVHPVDTSRAAVAQTMYIGTKSVKINRASGTLSLTGVDIDGTSLYSTFATSMKVQDDRDYTTDPQTEDAGYYAAFKANAAENLSDGGSFFGEITFRKYGTGTDWSGGAAHQLGFTDNGNIWHRSGTSTTWGTWYKQLSTKDLSLIGGAKGGGTNSVFYENDQAVTDDYTITSGKNAMSAGDITINTGVTVTVPTGSSWVIV